MAVIAISLFVAMTRAEDVHDLLLQGEDLKPADVADLEEKVSGDPQDLATRTRLLGYYFPRGHLRDPAILENRNKHILWLIRNSPEASILASPEGQLEHYEDPEGYAEARQAWHDQIARNPNNPTILYHAAQAFTLSNRELAIELLEKALSLDGSDPRLAQQLGNKYALGRFSGRSEEANVRSAEKALAAFERAYELSDDEMRGVLLVDLAENAFVAKKYAKAREYATAALNDNPAGWNQANRTHFGHLILGRVALLEGNVEEAKFRLIAAGTIQGSPQLDSFGPDMSLAAKLLEKGEKDVVLRYFELCAEFWELGKDDLADWTVLVTGDRMPDFSTNLRF